MDDIVAQRNCSIIVERNEIFRQGLIGLLSQAGCLNCLGFQSIEELEEAAEPGWSSALFLVNFGREIGGVAGGVARLKVGRPQCRVVVLSEQYSHGQILGAIKAGAAGYILTNTSGEALIKSLEIIALGEHVIPKQALQLLVASEPVAAEPALRIEKQRTCASFGLLSARELDVLGCVSQGMSNKVIARKCDVSEGTVKVHVRAILRKIRVKNRTEAARWAWDNGLGADGRAGNGRGASLTAN